MDKERKAIIKNSDMTEDMQQDAINVANGFNTASASYVNKRQAFTGDDIKSVGVDDTVINNQKPKKERKFVNGISNIAKFFAKFGEVTKGIFKSVFYGALTFSGLTLAGTLPKAFAKGNKFKETIMKFGKLGVKGKLITGFATAGVVTFHVIKGILKANKKSANVDHSLHTGHNG